MSENVGCVAAGPNAENGFPVARGIRGRVKRPATISSAFDVSMRRVFCTKLERRIGYEQIVMNSKENARRSSFLAGYSEHNRKGNKMTRLEIYKECVGEFGIDPAMVDEFVVSEYYNPIESGDPDEEVPVDVAADIRAEWMPIFANWVRQCKEKASNYPLPSVPSEAPEPVE